ncbi:hypothetical protein C7458_108284 [Williamsia muralis]|nr:hypothetical protein C7458_108284 [Williamsia marianensis]
MNKLVRPYSIYLFVLAVPVSYVSFVFGFNVLLMIVERTIFDVSDGIYYFSITYVVSCYLWIPATWLLLSIGGRFVQRRRASGLSPDEPER